MEQVWAPWNIRVWGPASLTSPSAVSLSIVHCEMNPCRRFCEMLEIRLDGSEICNIYAAVDSPGLSSSSVCVHGFNGSIKSLSVRGNTGPETDSIVTF